MPTAALAAAAVDEHHAVHLSGDSHSCDDGTAAARRQRLSRPYDTAQRSRSAGPAPEWTDDFSDSGSDGEGQQLLPHSRLSGRTQHSDQASGSAAFDGVETQDGGSSRQGSYSGSWRGGGGGARWRRWFPGLADFYDGTTPELVAVALGERLPETTGAA